jgi:hypothetical protein
MNWFDQIGLAYAQNFDEVEAARSLFEQQRETILGRLTTAACEALTGKGLNLDDDTVTQRGWVDIFIAREWTSVRDKGKRQSGISFGLGVDPWFTQHDGGRFGFGAYVFLRMGEPRFKKLRQPLENAATSNGCVLDYAAGKDRSACLRTSWIVPAAASFTLDAFVDAVLRLPEVFVKTDGALASAYQKSKAS